jgi:uncharacterized protein (TIGR00369 family)
MTEWATAPQLAPLLTEEQQQERRAWFRRHWEEGVAFNRTCRITVRRWELDGVELDLPYAAELSAHEGIFHGGVIAALIDTSATAAVMAGHDFNLGSRAATVSMAVQYLSAAPNEDVVAYARCTRRGKRTHFAEVTVRSQSGRAIAQGLVTVSVAGKRRGLEDLDS